jgi:hypothetical protein
MAGGVPLFRNPQRFSSSCEWTGNLPRQPSTRDTSRVTSGRRLLRHNNSADGAIHRRETDMGGQSCHHPVFSLSPDAGFVPVGLGGRRFSRIASVLGSLSVARYSCVNRWITRKRALKEKWRIRVLHGPRIHRLTRAGGVGLGFAKGHIRFAPHIRLAIQITREVGPRPRLWTEQVPIYGPSINPYLIIENFVAGNASPDLWEFRALILIFAPILAPFFPLRLKPVPQSHVQTLHIPRNNN